MMEEDENILHRYGTPLEPLDEDEIPSKKPIAVEDQIATDNNGRRRFHGAFTGGFSAGFWNTVGSLEGWKPQSFKSSRSEKADTKQQKAIDFMDEEDLGEFGIAPQRTQTTEEFTSKDLIWKDSNRKRKLQNTFGPIPGVPVLQQLLEPAKENVAIRLLKKMGWKPGQGIGARQTRKEKKAASERNAREHYIMKKYGCDLGSTGTEPSQEKNISDDEDDDDNDSLEGNITFAPDDFEPIVFGNKDNTFGLGYTGLRGYPAVNTSQHIDLFSPPFEGMGKDNKKLSIRGQAFGVGALEEEDEDIYAHDDMTKYDFSLSEIKNSSVPKKQSYADFMVLEGFHTGKVNSGSQKKIFNVKLPNNFKPRNWSVRKTRFEPLDDNKAAMLKRQDEHKVKGLGRHDLDPDKRANILGETSKTLVEQEKKSATVHASEKGKKNTYLNRINEKYKESDSKRNEVLRLINAKQDNFSKGETLNVEKDNGVKDLNENVQKENEEVQAEVRKITESMKEHTSGVFKPFINNEAKQERYEKFIEANLKNDDEEITKFLETIQPLSMSEWDREMEKKEFLQARKIYKPLKGLMSDRFVSETDVLAEKEAEKLFKSKQTVKINRTKVMWKPCADICKRFNVPEPFGGTMAEEKQQKKPRISIFNYLEESVNKKENFVTPVIIPLKVEKDKDNSDVLDVLVRTEDSLLKEIIEKKASKSKIAIPETEISEIQSGDGIKISVCPTPPKQSVKKFPKLKSDLEEKIEKTKNQHPSEKKDLFKAIFESSSEDENDDEENQGKRDVSKIEDTSSINSTDILDSINKSAAEINILRNTSPSKGIFASYFKGKSESRKDSPKVDDAHISSSRERKEATPNHLSNNKQEVKFSSNVSTELDEDENIYGPKIPTNVTSSVDCLASSLSLASVSIALPSSQKNENDKKLVTSKKSKNKSLEIIEEWVEKTKTLNKNKKKKKHKDKCKEEKSYRKHHKKEKKLHKDKKLKK